MTLHLGQIFFTEARTFMFLLTFLSAKREAMSRQIFTSRLRPLKRGSMKNQYVYISRREKTEKVKLNRFAFANLFGALSIEVAVIRLIEIALDL